MSFPLPKSGKVRYIVHLSDIHIRTGDINDSRYNEYKQVFDTLFTILQNKTNNETVCLITGDIFHDKLKADSCSIKLFNYFIYNISNIMPIYIIAGNHDLKQDKPNQPDILEACLDDTIYNNVKYLKETGVYWANDVAFSVVSVKDTLDTNSAGGIKTNLPEFPKPESKPYRSVGLFHGTVKNATFDFNKKATEGYPLEWFGCDFDTILLGDIHKPQVEKTKDNTIYGYAGSLIQQNFGEHPIEHGFLYWDLHNCETQFIQVPNDTAFLKLHYIDGRWKTVHKENLTDITLPKNLKTRIVGEIPRPSASVGSATEDAMDSLWNILQNHNVSTHKKEMQNTMQNDVYDSSPTEQNENASFQRYDIQMTPETWIDYLYNNEYNYDKTYCDTPTNLCINEQYTYVKSIKEKNKDIEKAIKQYEQEQPEKTMRSKQENSTSCFRISFVAWNYILCFGTNNYVNLEENDGLTLINGPNGIGKSAFLEIISLGLFGSAIPSRYDNSTSSSIICSNTPKNCSSNIRINIIIGDKQYEIRRTFTPQSKDAQKLNILSSIIRDMSDGTEVKSKQTEVNNWITEHIGTKEDFLTWCLITQGNDKDFLHLSPKDQKTMIDRTVNINSLHSFISVLETSEKAHNKAKKELEQYVLQPITEIEELESDSEKQLQERKETLEKARKNLYHIQNNQLRYPVEHYFNAEQETYILTEATEAEGLEEMQEDQFQLYELRGKLGNPPSEKTERVDIDIDEFFSKPEPPLVGKPYDTTMSHTVPDNPLEIYNNYIQWNSYIPQDNTGRNTATTLSEDNASFDSLIQSVASKNTELENLHEKVKFISASEAYKERDNATYIVKEKNNMNVYKRNYERLSTRADELERLDKELQHLYSKRNQTQKSLYKTNKDVQELPFNENCWACNQNPLIITQRCLNNDLESYNNQIYEKEQEYEKWNNGKTIDYLRKRAKEFKESYEKIDELLEKRDYIMELSSYADYFDTIDTLKNEIQQYNTMIATIAMQEKQKCAEQLFAYSMRYKQWQAYIYDELTKRIIKAEKIEKQRIIQEDYSKAVKAKELHNYIENESGNIRLQEDELKRNKQYQQKQKEARFEYDTICYHLETITDMKKGLQQYRKSVYKDIIMPALLELTNTYIHYITTSLSLILSFDQDGNFIWQVKRSGNNLVSLEKCSGFERNIINIALRIALRKIGKNNSTCIPTQLFIDESFVSSDETNLEKVPRFLNMLIDNQIIDNLIIVSHLEKIKNTIDTIIPIYVDNKTSLSYIQSGTFIQETKKNTNYNPV